MNFLEKYNTDDVFFRGVIIGLLSKLNETITYSQTNNDQVTTQIYIPFFYSMVGDEPFLQDFYLSYEDCDGKPAFAEGNYDVIPRGVLELGSISIDTGSATTKFVRGSYAKEVEKENGIEMVTYSSYFNPIPLRIQINGKIKVDTTLDAFKVQQSVLEILYKRFIYYFYYKGFRIPVQVSMPDSVPDKQPNNFQMSYGSQRGEAITLSFAMDLETYLPDLDLTTERFRGNLMQGGIKLNVEFGTVPPDNSQIISGIGVYAINNDVKGETGATGAAPSNP
jgi:hypothetical protein